MYEMPLVGEFEARPRLAPHASDLAEYLRAIPSPGSSRKLQERFLAFIRWVEPWLVEGAEVISLPVNPTYVLLYAVDLNRRDLAMTTIVNYMSAIGTVHRALGFYAPTQHPMIREFIAQLRRRRAGRGLRKAASLSEEEVTLILDTLRTPRRASGGRMETERQTEVRAALDRALLLTMIEAGLRRGEASRLTWEAVKLLNDGSAHLLVRSHLPHGSSAELPVTKDCADAILDIRSPGPRHSSEHVFGLSDSQISRRLKAMCAAAGIDPRNVSGNTPRMTLLRRLRDWSSPMATRLNQIRLNPAGILSDHPYEPVLSHVALREQNERPYQPESEVVETGSTYSPEPEDTRSLEAATER